MRHCLYEHRGNGEDDAGKQVDVALVQACAHGQDGSGLRRTMKRYGHAPKAHTGKTDQALIRVSSMCGT